MPTEFLNIPDRAELQIKRLVQLSVEHLQALRKALDGDDPLKAAESDLDITPAEALSVVSAASNLRTQREGLSLTDEQFLSDVVAVSGEFGSDQKSALLELCAATPKTDKGATLLKAFIPWFCSSSSVVEARPVFDEEKNEIERYVCSAMLSIAVHDPADYEYKKLVFQLDRDGLKELKKCLRLAEKKLVKLTSDLTRG